MRRVYARRVDPLDAILWYVVLLFSLTFHEAAHAWAAQRGGDPTAYLGGQVTLDPRPHIQREPFGMVFAPLLFFAMSGFMIGWASTPYDPRWAIQHPRRAAWMALAGPAANALLVLASAIAIRVGMVAGVFEAPPGIAFDLVALAEPGTVWETVATLLSIAFTLNLLLCVFNLIPLPPLDGGSAVGLLLPERVAVRMRLAFLRPGWSLVGILVAWFAIGRIFRPVHGVAIRLLYPEFAYG